MKRFLIKGLLRDRSRSMFPIMMVATGAFLTVLLYGWMKGAMGNMVDTNAKFDTGHVKIMTRAYKELADQMPNDLALLGVDGILKQLRDSESTMRWVPRIRFGGLLDIPDDKGETRSQGPVMGLGLDLSPGSPERDILNIENAIIEGKMPEKENEILVSKDFARKLGVKVGETATLLSSTMYGSMAMYNFKVSGIIWFGVSAMDRGTIIANIKGVQSALDMTDGASEILGYYKNMTYIDKEMKGIAEKFNREYSREENEFSSIMLTLGEQNGLGEYVEFVEISGSIMVFIFVIAMSIVLWNAGLMNGLRRYGEVGLRLAMGEAKGRIYRSLIYESIAIGLIGAVIGTIIGLGFSYFLQTHPLNFADKMQQSTLLLSDEIGACVTLTSYYIGFFPGLLASVLGTMFAGIGIYRRKTSQLFKELEI